VVIFDSKKYFVQSNNNKLNFAFANFTNSRTQISFSLAIGAWNCLSKARHRLFIVALMAEAALQQLKTRQGPIFYSFMALVI